MVGMIPGMGAFAAQSRKKVGGFTSGSRGGPPGGAKPDGVHPYGNGVPGAQAMPQKQDASNVAAQMVARVRSGKVDQQLVKLMRGYDPQEGYPAWAPDERVWEQAEAAVQPDGAGMNLDDPWLVVAHVYKALGGRVVPGAQMTDGRPDPQAEPDGDEGGMVTDDGSGGGAGPF